MKTNKETVLASNILSPDGRMMAECLMEKDGVSIERLFNLLGQIQSDVVELQNYSEQMNYDINSHIMNHD
jgi:hypothetical protein